MRRKGPEGIHCVIHIFVTQYTSISVIIFQLHTFIRCNSEFQSQGLKEKLSSYLILENLNSF